MRDDVQRNAPLQLLLRDGSAGLPSFRRRRRRLASDLGCGRCARRPRDSPGSCRGGRRRDSTLRALSPMNERLVSGRPRRLGYGCYLSGNGHSAQRDPVIYDRSLALNAALVLGPLTMQPPVQTWHRAIPMAHRARRPHKARQGRAARSACGSNVPRQVHVP